MKKHSAKRNALKAMTCIIVCCLSLSFAQAATTGVSLVSSTVSYTTSTGESGSSICSMPIFISSSKIMLGTVPAGILNILEKSEAGSSVTYKCKNAKGTQFVVKLAYSTSTKAEMTVKTDAVSMVYKCSVSNEKPYYNMVDLGLSCKWGLTNYYSYSLDVITATFNAGKAMTYDAACKLFGSGKQHLPSSSQIQELLTKCSWEFVDNPFDANHKCYLVTGPNGNNIFLPCSDGSNGSYSSAWYLSSNALDAFLSYALQLNVQSRIIYPFERNYYGCVRLVEDK